MTSNHQRVPKRGVDLIFDVLPFSRRWNDDRTLPAMQSATPATTADHMVQ